MFCIIKQAHVTMVTHEDKHRDTYTWYALMYSLYGYVYGFMYMHIDTRIAIIRQAHVVTMYI